MRIQGFTLIELMISLTISLLLTTAIFELYFVSIKNAELTHELALMQNNARIASDIITRDLRMAGYLGCLTLNSETLIHNYTAANLSLETSLQDNPAAKNQIQNSDNLVVRRGSESTITLNGVMPSVLKIPIEHVKTIKAGNLMIISNCTNAEIFKVKKFSKNTIVPNHRLSQRYQPGAQLTEYLQHQYYIANTGRVNHHGQTINALYRSEFGEPDQELIEGLAMMKISYGFFSEKWQWYSAAEINQLRAWPRVKNVKIDLLLQSSEEILAQPQAYYFQGEMVMASDRRIYKEWVINVDLRERQNRM